MHAHKSKQERTIRSRADGWRESICDLRGLLIYRTAVKHSIYKGDEDVFAAPCERKVDDSIQLDACRSLCLTFEGANPLSITTFPVNRGREGQGMDKSQGQLLMRSCIVPNLDEHLTHELQ